MPWSSEKKERAVKPWPVILLFILVLTLVAAGGCGRRGKLIPRDETRPADEQIPSGWKQNTPEPFGAELGADGLFEQAGDPARLRARDLTPEPTPEATPPAADETDEADQP